MKRDMSLRSPLVRVGLGVALLAAGILLWRTHHAASGRIPSVTIRFWNGFTGPDGRTMLRIVKEFNRITPGGHVLMQRMDWSTYYNKLFVAGMGGRCPEVFVIHTDVLPRFQRAGFLRPIDDLLRGMDPVPLDDFDPEVWRMVLFDGQTCALPLDVHPMGMYYNRALLREAGVVGPDGDDLPPADKEGFLSALRKVREKTGAWGFVFTNFRNNVYSLMLQFGGRAFNDDMSQCTLDDPANVAALQFCVDLIKEGLSPQPQDMDSWLGFRQGKVAMVWEGPYMLGDLQRVNDLDVAGSPIPQIGEAIQAVQAGSHNLCLRSGLAGKELELCWRFCRFLSDRSLDWAAGGQVPVRKSLRETDRFRSMGIQSQFAREIPYLQYLPRVPFNFEFVTELDLAVDKALRGAASPQQALEEATSKVNQVIQRDRAQARRERP